MKTRLSKSQTHKRIFFRRAGILLVLGMLFGFASCRSQPPSAPRILKEGDEINGMIVTTGIPHAPPLEVFCRFDEDEDATNTINCDVPPLPKLAIGHLIGMTGGAWQELDWSKVDWQVYLDSYRLDLDTFDQESYVEPELLSSPSPIREVFKQRKTWDIVLIDPTFGMHTLLCSARTETIVYNWVVNFMINSTSGPLNLASP